MMLLWISRRGSLFILLVALCGCAGAAEPARPNVILVTVDTLRADHMACYGYSRNTMPFVEGLAKQGILFSNAYSTSSWTAPSMASLATALYPREHGVLHGAAKQRNEQEVLDGKFLTLAEALKGAGYKTFGIFSTGHTTRKAGFDQGFDVFQSLGFAESPRPNQAAAEMKPLISKSSPYFLWIHYFDPHVPYTAREPWISAYSTNAAACAKWSGMDFLDQPEKKAEMTEFRNDPTALQTLIDLYDSELGYTDHYIEDLFHMLEIGEDSLVIVTADHGEQFMEHGRLYHAGSLYEPEVRVPLIIRLPSGRRAGEVVSRPVSNKDVFPTILDALGITASAPGSSLLQPQTEPVYLELDLDQGRDWKGVRRNNWKLLCHGSSKCELYDLSKDPGEKQSGTELEQEQADRMHAELLSWMETHPVFSAGRINQKLTNDQKEKLRSLGYLK